MNTFFGFQVDYWTFWGFTAQFLFLLSFIIQWYKSEKTGRSHLPYEFWWIRLIASLVLVVYVIHRKDIVFLIAVLIQIVMYFRNIFLIRKQRKNEDKIGQ